MLSSLTSLSSLIKTKSYHIDYPLFRLHYQVTVAALLAFSLILTTKILFGDPIDCKARNAKSEPIYDNLCFSQGTFTTVVIQNPEEGKDCHHPSAHRANIENGTISTGASSLRRVNQLRALSNTTFGRFLETNLLDVHRSLSLDNDCFKSNMRYMYSAIPLPLEDDQVMTQDYWHQYYQYVPIILFVQAILFYLPHYLWKLWENGIVSSICKQLHENRFSPVDYIDSHYHLIDYIQSCFLLNKDLVYKYYFCHVLLLINLVGQTVLLNAVFNDQFYSYGSRVYLYYFHDIDFYGFRPVEDDIRGGRNDLNNPMDFVFPKVTACTLEFLGLGLKTDIHQFICTLPLNIFHDRFYLMLWYWFLFLALVTTLQIAFNLLYAAVPLVRRYIFRRRYGPYLSEENRHSSSLPEIFLLDLIGQNSDKFAFAALLRKLSKEDYRTTPSENQSLV